MIWGTMKTLAGQFVHKNAFNFDALQPILCDELCHKLLIQDNQGVSSIVLAEDPATLLQMGPLPDDYGAVLSLTQGKGTPFDPVPLPNLASGDVRSDRVYTITGGNLYARTTGTMLLFYNKRLAIAADAEENIVLKKYSNVYLWGLLTLAGIQLEDDEMIDKYSGKYGDALATVNGAYLDAAYGSGLAAQVPGGSI